MRVTVDLLEGRGGEEGVGGVQLEAGASRAWIVDGRGGFELTGRFRSEVDETGLLVLLEHDPAREGLAGAELARIPFAVGPSDNEPVTVAHDVLAPHGVDHDYEVRVAWPDDAGAPLFIDELRAEHDAPSIAELPPVIFVSVDTLAAHALGLYGYERDTSPNLERFAEDAVVFDRARANAPWTAPSYVSQFTGLLPPASENTGRERGEQRFHLLPQRYTLAELMARRGYACEAIVDNPWLSAIDGVEQGFERFDTEPAQRHLDDVEGGMRLVLPRGIERLQALVDAGRAPFLFLQVLDVHGTYFTPDDLTGRFGSRDVRADDRLLRVKPDGDKRAQMVHRYIAQSLGDPIPEADEFAQGGASVSVRRLTAAYDEGVADFDREFGRFVERLKEGGLYDDALIVVTADHGEARGDDPWPFTHKFPREDTLHVPLLVKLPGGERGGTRVSEPVSLVDLYPTFAELVGVEVDEERLDGRSFVPLLRGETRPARASIATNGAFEGRRIVMGSFALRVYEHRRFSAAEFLSYPPLFEAWSTFDPATAERLAADGFESRGDDPWVTGGDKRVATATWAADLRTSRRRFGREAALYRELVRLDEDGATVMSLDDEANRARALAMGIRLRDAMDGAAGRALEQIGYVRSNGADAAAREALERLGYVDRFVPHGAEQPATGAPSGSEATQDDGS